MTISIEVDPGIDTVVTETTRVGTINATITASSDSLPTPEAITSVTSTTHEGIIMTPGTTSCTLVGTYEDSFTDLFTFVEQGSSDLGSTPTVVTGLKNLPSNKLFFDLTQDQRDSVTKSYTVTVNETQTFTVTHVIRNEYETIRAAVASYYDGVVTHV